MTDTIIIDHMTKDYGLGRGAFDITLKVHAGECYGFLGPNGAGKTTTIRQLMGFTRPDSGHASILDKDCWREAAILKNHIGYIPGEISLPAGMSGTGFLKMMEKMHGITDSRRTEMLVERFRLDTSANVKKMSFGMKRKLAIITAFMHDPEILILDEPSSGLDPLMQKEFIDFLSEEKARGKTLFLSSHIFHEVDVACDRLSIIKEGHIVSEIDLNARRREEGPSFDLEQYFMDFYRTDVHEEKGGGSHA
jgi:ABC-2 type transport system ATP-binding protein